MHDRSRRRNRNSRHPPGTTAPRPAPGTSLLLVSVLLWPATSAEQHHQRWGRDLVTTGTCPSSVSCPRSPSAARDAGGGGMTDPSPRTTTTSSPGRIYTTGSYCQGSCTILVILPIILKVHLYIYIIKDQRGPINISISTIFTVSYIDLSRYLRN